MMPLPVLVNEGLERVNELIDQGMEFDKDEGGHLKLGLEGGHSKRRILHADGDATGKMMTSFMLKKVLAKPNVTPFEYCAALKIIVEDHICLGVQTLQYMDGENIIFSGKATVLATGGLSRLYSRSTNPYTATGDGIAPRMAGRSTPCRYGVYPVSPNSALHSRRGSLSDQ